MSRLKLTLACQSSDRTRPILDGTVRIEGCDVTPLAVDPEEIFHRAFRYHEFDIAELSLSTYSIMRARGDAPYVGIPVFPSRAFRHSAIYVRVGSTIRDPSDLNGKRIGVPDYQQTAGVWIRGILAEHHAFDPTSVTWVQGGQEQAGRTARIALDLPVRIKLEAAPEGRTLNQLLEAGELAAIISPRPPQTSEPNATQRLFVDYRAAEEDYFRRTRLFPIMHLVGIRAEIDRQSPWLAASLLKAFSEAKQICMAQLGMINFLRASLPWLPDDLVRVRALMGDDHWPYGFKANEACLDKFLSYAQADGLLTHPLAAADIIADSTKDPFRV